MCAFILSSFSMLPRREELSMRGVCSSGSGLAKAEDVARAKHFVLVHGLGHGAWCWYKVKASLQAAGHRVTALDLTSNGDDKTVADTVTTIVHFLQPLTDFLRDYEGQVILVGHSLGGSAISYAMEAYPHKIEKAIFLAAFMPVNGQTFLPIKALLARVSLILKRIMILKLANGIGFPSSVSINLRLAQANFYNRSPLEDVNLAHSCLKPSPFRALFNVLHLTEARYGSVPRFYLKTVHDLVIPPNLQESFIMANPPENAFSVPESDHSPFFSQPAALVDLLTSIANNPNEH